MVKTESVTINGKEFIKTYSDAGLYIHGGNPEADYEEAIDPADADRTYTETGIPIEETEADATEIVEILTGGAE